MALRSARWTFSRIANSSAPGRRPRRTTTGTSSSPARWAARQRRSPAMISKVPGTSPIGRTTIGWMMPRWPMETRVPTAPSRRSCRRGLRGLARRNSTGTLRCSSALAAARPASSKSPISAASPRPSRGFAPSSAMIATRVSSTSPLRTGGGSNQSGRGAAPGPRAGSPPRRGADRLGCRRISGRRAAPACRARAPRTPARCGG